MDIVIKILKEDNETTISRMFIDGKFICYVLEDQYQENKVKHETRIPELTYKLGVKDYGGFHNRYSKKFPEIHKGMIQIMDVPNFSDVLIHIGNDDDDTSGCLLVGNNVNLNNMTVTSSRIAYEKVYPIIIDELLKGNEVCLEIQRKH